MEKKGEGGGGGERGFDKEVSGKKRRSKKRKGSMGEMDLDKNYQKQLKRSFQTS